MFFNSIEFAVFLVCVLTLYFIMPYRAQNRMLLVASYFFYGWWDWRFLSLILISTFTDYLCGLKINRAGGDQYRKAYLALSITVNLGLLAFFKYWNFFIDSFAEVLTQFGFQANLPSLNIILPVGISFYTFQTMTYTIDIYRKELKPSESFLDFALFVAFFPQLVAGPIERASRLLPQIQKTRQFKLQQFLRGLHLIFWGLFKKIFVADNLGRITDAIFENPSSSGIDYMVAGVAFAFQIYGDFSGYSDIARGTAKCMGIELMHNFRQPYFAVSPSDFWRQWHISLSTWLRDYLYIPLGGNRLGTLKTYRNLMITMLLGGLWHGAAWNFVIWGAYHGLVLSVNRWIEKHHPPRRNEDTSLFVIFIKVFIMFNLTCLGWLFFRAQSLSQIGTILTSILGIGTFYGPWIQQAREVAFFISIPFAAMAFQALRKMRPDWFLTDLLTRGFMVDSSPVEMKSILYGVLFYLLCLYGASAQSFIYFQF